MRGGPLGRLLALPACRRLLRACLLLSAGVAALVVVQWTLVAAFVSAVFAGRLEPGELLPLLAGVLAVAVGRAGLLGLRDVLAGRASASVRRDVRTRLGRALLRRCPETLDGERAGELATTATAGVASLDAVVARLAPALASAAVLPVLIALVVLVLDPASGALLLLTGPLLVLLLWLVGSRAGAAARAQWADLGQLGALLVDALRVLPTLVAYGRGPSSARWLAQVSESYRVATMRVLRTAFLSGFVLELGATLCTALVAVTVGVRVFEGELGFERALLVLLLTPEFFAPLRVLGADVHAGLEARPGAERVFAVLDEPQPARGTGPVPTGVPHVSLRGVVLRHGDRTVLDGIDLELPPGSRTALVGPSGAGKTSLARLLLGLREPDAGEVLVGGVPLAELDPDAWLARVAHVPERPWLLPGTLADNVRLGRAEATDAEVEHALHRAAAADLLRRLPQGLHTPLGEDAARLSGGERLRIALARAFVKDAPVLVLDEPTSQLDAGTEAAVLASLEQLAQGRTVLTITHRRAPLALHDRVVELVDGRARDAQAVR